MAEIMVAEFSFLCESIGLNILFSRTQDVTSAQRTEENLAVNHSFDIRISKAINTKAIRK